ncbi:MAG: PfkB family carbohydrate kinase [Pseudomonadota bacterium]
MHLKPQIAVFSSHVASGAVGNRASVFALELLGFEVWAIPTVHLAWHPGHGPSTRMVPDEGLFAAHVDELCGKISPDAPIAVLSGYLGSASQAAPIARFVAKARQSGSLVHYLCDPVLGDHGGLYVSPSIAEAIRDQLVSLADIITPNLFELGWLSSSGEASDMGAAVEQAKQLKKLMVLATSVPAMMVGNVANVLVSGEQTSAAEHRMAAKVPNGTGDLVSSLFLARLLLGAPPDKALGMASAAVFALAMRANQNGEMDFHLSRDQEFLRRTTSMPVRTIVTGKVR